MPNIQIKVSGKIAVCRKKYLVSSNANYAVDFDFDEEWSAHTVKTARFIFDSSFVDVAFSGNTVQVPKIPPCESLGVGVYTDSLASTTAEVGCVLSVRDCSAEAVGELSDDQYESLLTLINSLDLRQIKRVERISNRMKITFNDNTSASFPIYDGTSVHSAAVGTDGRLSVTLTDGTTIIAGNVKGEKGDKGDKGDTGAKGDRGDIGAKGEKGDKGDRGNPFRYSDFTAEQLAALKGEKGETGIKGAKGDKGDPFRYADFTVEQLAALKGDKGDKGEKGVKGDKGDKGDIGLIPKLSIGTVTTVDTSQEASATITGGNAAPVLSLSLPRGKTGKTPLLSIGTVTTLPSDESAGASLTGSVSAPVLNLSIPKGKTGMVPSFRIGKVTTVSSGSDAAATITGSNTLPVLNLSIPKGDTPPLATELSAASTDSEAASAKCVFEAIKTAVGTALGGSY